MPKDDDDDNDDDDNNNNYNYKRKTQKEMVKNNRRESLNTGKDFEQHQGSSRKLVQ
jgi:hypothetical protein